MLDASRGSSYVCKLRLKLSRKLQRQSLSNAKFWVIWIRKIKLLWPVRHYSAFRCSNLLFLHTDQTSLVLASHYYMACVSTVAQKSAYIVNWKLFNKFHKGGKNAVSYINYMLAHEHDENVVQYNFIWINA